MQTVADAPLQAVVEAPSFRRTASAFLSEEEIQAVLLVLAANPFKGRLIKGAGGVRKVRIPAKGKGKSGGARVVYYWYSDDEPIHALLAYPKNQKTDLTPAEAKIVAEIAKQIAAEAKRKKP
ncbi:type II toxin-antitoxin system RelE/ParE family toxin [Hoeflea poritis]|uniref:Type II toxin-antitoxin system RelE/ParE family toxin n=1 Tax=Hoeflea poritis TaxID=2993659 RepID=A0ABT4VTI2_9HYPH|nr:type II toxin-antitoxin system RelE/ParE family toxin [Hoeflea poritis]MDA4848022.1 type II toxin-antitoxin system RelE/ParE family toxin [Hoeflea poritis]